MKKITALILSDGWTCRVRGVEWERGDHMNRSPSTPSNWRTPNFSFGSTGAFTAEPGSTLANHHPPRVAATLVPLAAEPNSPAALLPYMTRVQIWRSAWTEKKTRSRILLAPRSGSGPTRFPWRILSKRKLSHSRSWSLYPLIKQYGDMSFLRILLYLLMIREVCRAHELHPINKHALYGDKGWVNQQWWCCYSLLKLMGW